MLAQQVAFLAVTVLDALGRASAATSFHAFVQASMPDQGPLQAEETHIAPSSDGPDARLAAMWVHQEELVDAASYREYRALAEADKKAAPVQESAPVDEPIAQEQPAPQEEAAPWQEPAAGREGASLGAVLRTCAFLVALLTSATTIRSYAFQALRVHGGKLGFGKMDFFVSAGKDTDS
mmetsp:Transcript_59899/g.155789  ORF Transcript_59899/g.155789 Transcript_59899/m.155789 type:complete len:179 (-) Transcript_59899:69-605(-)